MYKDVICDFNKGGGQEHRCIGAEVLNAIDVNMVFIQIKLF